MELRAERQNAFRIVVVSFGGSEGWLAGPIHFARDSHTNRRSNHHQIQWFEIVLSHERAYRSGSWLLYQLGYMGQTKTQTL